ncbi:MAG: hypothetical protein ABR595_08930 [Psychroflexus sp.]
MIKNSIKFVFVFGLLLNFLSCSNEPLEGEFPENVNPDNPTNPGTPTEPGEGSTGDYWPTAIDNIWYYETENADGSINENDYQILSETSVDGLPAYELDEFFVASQLESAGAAGEVTGYLIKNEGNYIFYNPGFEMVEEGAELSLSEFSYVFMKDYLEEGESFTESFVFNFTSSFDGGGEIGGFEPIEIEIEADLVITIVERDFEMTINEETYQNVIHLMIESTSTDSEFGESFTYTTEVYFAEDIGPIKILDENETEGFDSEIISYELN